MKKLLLTSIVTGVVVFAGCGGGSNSTESTGGAPTGQDQQTLNELYKGTYQNPPATAPKPQAGKNVFVISCGQSIAFCSDSVAGAQEAGDSIGWKTTVIDSKADVSIAAGGIRQAIAAKADGIVVVAIDCDYVKQAAVEAKSAGIPIVGIEAFDCNPSLYAATGLYSDNRNLTQWDKDYGATQGRFLAALKGGKDVQVMNFAYNDIKISPLATSGFEEAISQNCPDNCKVIPETFTTREATAGLQQKTEQALLQNPSANAIRVDSGGTLEAGVEQAVRTSGRDITIMGAEGGPPEMDLVRSGDVVGGVGVPYQWEGYASIDELNRIFNGQPVESSGIGLQAFGPTRNVPASGGYQAPVDFKALYKKAWGVGG